jgi:FixJ family two-component response regulator
MHRSGKHSTAGPTIVVVDDDAAVRNSLKFSLEIEGYSVRTYASPAEFLGGAEMPAGACLVIDQNMPGMSGLELLRALRQRGIRTPAILISAHASVALNEEAARRGVVVVEKPFIGNILLDRIHAAIAPDAG